MNEVKIRELLDKMMDELYGVGVDVSYFPEKAEDVLDKYAVILGELK